MKKTGGGGWGGRGRKKISLRIRDTKLRTLTDLIRCRWAL